MIELPSFFQVSWYPQVFFPNMGCSLAGRPNSEKGSPYGAKPIKGGRFATNRLPRWGRLLFHGYSSCPSFDLMGLIQNKIRKIERWVHGSFFQGGDE